MKRQGTEYDLSDLSAEVTERMAGSDNPGAGETITTTLSALQDAVAEFHRAELHKFGTFNLKWRKARASVLNGVTYEIPAHWRITFKAAPAFAEKIGEATGEPAK